MTGWPLLALAVAATAGPSAVVTVAPAAVTLGAGERGEVEVVARIDEGFRIQANPASEPFLVPARLELPGDERVRVGTPVYPPGKAYRLRGADEDLSVYQGTVVFRVPLEARPVDGDASPEETVLDGRLHYQACNELVCLRPSSAAVQVRVSLRPSRSAGPPDAETRWITGDHPEKAICPVCDQDPAAVNPASALAAQGVGLRPVGQRGLSP